MGILRQKTLPQVEPIIPVARAKPFDDPAWLFEAKYDGFRGLLHVTWGGCYMRSKQGTSSADPTSSATGSGTSCRSRTRC